MLVGEKASDPGQEDPGIELKPLHTQQGLAEVVCTHGMGRVVVVIRWCCFHDAVRGYFDQEKNTNVHLFFLHLFVF